MVMEPFEFVLCVMAAMGCMVQDNVLAMVKFLGNILVMIRFLGKPFLRRTKHARPSLRLL